MTDTRHPHADGDIESVLRQKLAFLSPLRLEVVDDSHRHAGHAGSQGGGHYQLLIVSKEFAGKTTLQRHRLVYGALDELMRSRIHALSIRSMSPDEAK